jgi:hypothetical protein
MINRPFVYDNDHSLFHFTIRHTTECGGGVCGGGGGGGGGGGKGDETLQKKLQENSKAMNKTEKEYRQDVLIDLVMRPLSISSEM